MKHNWEYKRLGDICTFERGITYSKEDESEQVSDIIVLRSNNIDLETNSLNFSDLKYLNKDFRTNNDKKLRANSILICLSNGSLTHLGKTAYVERNYDMMFGGFMGLIVPKQQNPRYISYIFRSPLYFKFIDSLNRGANIRNLQISKLSNLNIPVPPMEVQERIVAELDKINEVIGDCRELLRNLDALAQSIFYDTFGDPISNPKGWPIRQISEIGEIERGTGISKKDFVANGSPCIHYGQLHTAFGPTAHKHLTCIPKNLLSKPKIAHPGDVIMAITSEDVEGSCKSTAWLGDYDIIVGSDAAILHHNQNGVYISYYTLTSAFSHEKAKYAKGFKVTHISSKEIGSIPIMVPPLSLQQQFAAQIEAIEAQKKAVESTISKMKTLLDSRMDYWFND